MIYCKTENYKIIQQTKSKESAILYGLSETYEDDGAEQAYDGSWYVKGHTPEKPEAITNAERVAELKALLASKDYWTSKRADGEYTEEEWAEKVAQRKAWREEINMLENKEIEE